MTVRRLLWIAIAGLVLGILGVFWDSAWHARQPGGDLTGGSEIVEAHWLMILGVLIIFVALAMAARAIREPRSAVVSVWIAFIGSLAMVVGFAWDSARHVQGTESAVAHALIYAGLLAVAVAIPASLFLSRGKKQAGISGKGS